jgi:hypothetical protein
MAKFKRLLLGCATILASACHAQAATYCAPPIPPSCVARLIKSAVVEEFNTCRGSVIAFQTDANRFIECLRQAEIDVNYDLEQSILRFNRCANEGFCSGVAR